MVDHETQPIVGEKKLTSLRVLHGTISYRNFRSNLQWLCLFLLLLGQLVGIILFTIWAADCFFREFRTTPTCQHFVLFPLPGVFESVWLCACIGVSLFLIIQISYCSPAFCGVMTVLRHSIKKKYFYKVFFVLIVVCGYDVFVMSYSPNTLKTMAYLLFMFEKIFAVVLIFLLNFIQQFWSRDDAKVKWWLYKMSLAIYSLDCYLLALLGSTIAVYKVLSVSGPKTAKDQPGVKSVVALMLLITNNGLRYFMADFFMSKLFDDGMDILGGGTKTVTESISILALRQARRTPMTPVKEFLQNSDDDVFVSG